MSRAKSAFWGSVSSQISMVIFMFLSIAITPLILKFLNKEEYGFYAILFQIIGYLSILDFGLGGAITRSLAATRGEDEESRLAINKIISTSFYTFSVLGCIVIVAGFLLTPYIPQFFKMDSSLHKVAISITLTLSIFVGIQFPIKVFNNIFFAHQRQLLSNILGFSITLLNVMLPIVFLYLGQGLWSFVYTNIICSITEVFIIFSLIKKYYPFLKIRRSFFEKALLLQLFSFGFFLFLGTISYHVVFFTDRFFIGSFVSLTAATMYALSVKAPELSRELIFRITDNVYPAMVEISAREGEGKLKIIHQKLLLITVCLSTIAFWMIYIFNFWFIKLWVGDQFFIGPSDLVLALLVMFQLTILHLEVLCLFGMGEIRTVSLIGIVEAILNLALTFWFGKMYGVKGVLLATIVAGWLTAMWIIPYMVMNKLKIGLAEYLFKPILLPVITISSVGLFFYFVTRHLFTIIEVNWVNFIVACIILALCFLIFVWKFFLKNEFMEYIPLRFKKYFLKVS